MSELQRFFVIGDIHGEIDALMALLQQVELIDNRTFSWCGGAAILWFLGDFFDRGTDGIAVIDFIMRLQQEAAMVGGTVQSLLGNHEVAILSAYRFADQPARGPGGTFYSVWKRNGGQDSDLRRLTSDHIEWMTNLPAMACVGDKLLIHADSTFYRKYGHSIGEVNQAITDVLSSDKSVEWDFLLDKFTRGEFDKSHLYGKKRAKQMLQYFGGRQIIHGHTPIRYMTKQHPQEIREPLVYANRLCVNVDGGLSLGGNGVIYQFTETQPLGD
jgi:hypothetical protein